MPVKHIRRRVTGPLNESQKQHFRQATREVEAQAAEIQARGKARLKQQQAVGLPQIITALRVSRLSRGLSAAEVADKLQMNAGNFSRLENGQTNPTLATVTRLADAIGVTVVVQIK
jgi:ribosome-binding protein aMBF1 (putative translation factor)